MKLFLIIFAGIILLFLAFLFKYLRIIMNVFLNIPLKAMPENRPLSCFEEISFLSLKGHPLKGIFFKTHASCKGTIIFCHEFGADKSFCAPYNDFLLKNGYNVLSFDFRGHGQSLTQNGYIPRPWTTANEIDDFLGAVRYIKENNIAGPIGALGISRGAVTAIISASLAPEIKAVISDSAFSTMETMISYMQKWVSIFSSLSFIYKRFTCREYRILGKMAVKLAELKYHVKFPSLERTITGYQLPILFIHGKEDSFIEYRHAESLYARSSGPKKLWLIDKARHNEGIKTAPGEYARNTVDFLNKYLKGDSFSFS